ncbi:hypothetical protein MPDQ_002122 [Monascus purpureus]|uniref:Zn(2)-C6 fungal-type domain-containing protein n=1 Tax=Monascus purpureus TaxID=5098 RepID=A0A507QN25_MONPU|nr:hypothetical protein MPDQ_002122 [Monascus purpureus]BDD58237.1 hypothetical protein MAP00_003529 [Monascus purpureus]
MAEVGRVRAKKACNPCRIRKRKCNGELPCKACIALQYPCSYEQRVRRGKFSRLLEKRANAPPENISSPSPSRADKQQQQQQDDPSTLPGSQLQLIEANSPAVFVRELGLKIAASAAPQLRHYSWNLRYATEDLSWTPQYLTLTEILSMEQMSELTSVYFAEVHPVYDFLDRQQIEELIGPRWMKGTVYDSSDSLLCGVAALGCLFSQSPSTLEEQLVQSARLALEHSSNLSNPSIHHVLGWLLRVIYLRLAGSPQATWIATCTLMHMIETIRLHFEPSHHSILAESMEDHDPERRRRIYSVARLFNTWVSFDCGRSPVELRGGSSVLPKDSWTVEQVQLWQSSDFLNPDRARTYAELLAEFHRLCALDPQHGMLQLIQCNIALCMCRRVRALRFHIPDDFFELFVALSRKSLATARRLASQKSPWCHVLNIPFQLSCTFLSFDKQDCFSLLDEALSTLHYVVEQYNTKSAVESYHVACWLATMKHRRRCEELDLLGSIIRSHDASLSEGATITPVPQDETSQYPELNLDFVNEFLSDQLSSLDQFPFAMP